MSDKYTTLNDLKKWPKLYDLAVSTAVDLKSWAPIEADIEIVDLFSWDQTKQGYDFWHAVHEGRLSQPRAMRPELFEEEPCEFVEGRRYRLKNTCQDFIYITQCGDNCGLFRGGIDGATLIANFADFEPIPDEQEPQCHKDEVTNIPAAENPGKLGVPDEQEEKLAPAIGGPTGGPSVDGRNAAMLDRDGEEEMCNTQELWEKPKPAPYSGLYNDTQREANLAVSDRIWRRRFEP